MFHVQELSMSFRHNVQNVDILIPLVQICINLIIAEDGWNFKKEL